ncbi:B30.2/SPRY domain-containing protein [Entamoeba marina]
MTQLEMVYLMKVSLHLCTFEDIKNLMMVSKKGEETIQSLKVNPWVINSPSLKKFMKYFKPETIECRAVGFFSPEVYEQVKCIRAPLWDDLKDEDKEIAKKFLSKVTNLDLYHSRNDEEHNKTNEFFVEEAAGFTNLRTVTGSVELVVKFFENYTQKGEMMYVNFPKRIKIDSAKGYAISFTEEFLGQMKELLSYIPNNDLTAIDIVVYAHPPEEDKALLKELLELQRVNYHYRIIKPNQTTSYEDCLCCYEGRVLVDGYVNGDKFNDLFEKSYTTTCVIRNIAGSEKGETWNVPKCITNMELSSDPIYARLNRRTVQKFNVNFNNLEELTVKDLRDVDFPSVLTNLVKIKVENSSNCRFLLDSPKLDHITLRDVRNCSFKQSIDSVKEIIICKANNCVLPYVSFENRSIHIEDCENLIFGEKEITIEPTREDAQNDRLDFLNRLLVGRRGGQHEDEDEDDEESESEDNESDSDSIGNIFGRENEGENETNDETPENIQLNNVEQIDQNQKVNEPDMEMEEKQRREEEEERQRIEEEERLRMEEEERQRREEEERYRREEEERQRREEEERQRIEEEERLRMEEEEERTRKEEIRLELDLKHEKEEEEEEEETKEETLKSPLEFMNIGLEDFNKLITDCLIYPSEIDLHTLLNKSTIFKMRAFHSQTRRIKVDGNVVQRVIPQGEEDVDMVVSSKFYESGDNLMIINPANPEEPIPAIIRYFEVEVQNYCIISIGLVNANRYKFAENRQVGWDPHSVGYHADDGCLFIGNGTRPIQDYGKAYGGKNGEKNIVGCGYNTLTHEIFYTMNGTKLNPRKAVYNHVSAAIGLEDFDPITINYGNTPFVFDLFGEMEKYKDMEELEEDESEDREECVIV